MIRSLISFISSLAIGLMITISGVNAQSRLAAAAIAPDFALPLIGTWKTHITGSGEVTLNIVNISADGQLEGSMHFSSQSYTLTFGQKVDKDKKIGVGKATPNGTAPAITINTAVGGLYALRLDGARLTGMYQRNNTDIPVSFQK